MFSVCPFALKRVGIPQALSIRSIPSTCGTSHLFPLLKASRCEPSNTRLRVNCNQFWLIGRRHSAYFCSGVRSFCLIPRPGTRNRVVWTKSSDERNCSFKSSGKQRKSISAYDSAKGIARSIDNMATNISQEGQVQTDVGSSMVVETKRRAKGKKKRETATSIAGSDIAEATCGTSEMPLPSGTRSKKVKQPAVGLETTSDSSPATEVADSGASTKKQQGKVTKSSSRKKNSSMKSQSSLKTEGESLKKTAGKKVQHKLYPATSKSVVVVESETKAKVIQGYLGEMFEVVPSHGHVRDLAARSGSVRPDDDFSMVWEVPSTAWSHLKNIRVALSGVKTLILATDPDREGEAIAWHIVEMLRQQDSLPEDVNITRVSFHEITESSIKASLLSPREIDTDLVDAYLARRALDYLIGFNVSPLLWRKLPGCQSAGRVQSAALALICDREKEIDEFRSQDYWTVLAQFQVKCSDSVPNFQFSSALTHFASDKLSRLSISSFVQAKDIEEGILGSKFVVIGSKTSQVHRNPPIPFITSSLQQDAANRLSFSGSTTMKLSQKLYETGLITYMRTDGLHLSDEAAQSICSFIVEKYGMEFASKKPRKYFKKVKNAQEAHEAVRPTDIQRLPSNLVGILDEDSFKLYTLIWSRTMACQMEPPIIKRIQCEFGNEEKSIIFRYASSKVEFPGFRAVYEDPETMRIRISDYDDDDDNDNRRDELFDAFCNLKCGQPLSLSKVELVQHATQPPPRYTEGSLVKKMEELGIGRPSTYAITIKVLKDRNYITVKNRTLYPEFRGRMVSAFLSHYFSEVTDYSFTADMETELDNISSGVTEWKGLLKDYWTRFGKYCESTSRVHVREVEKMLDKTFGDFLFSFLDGNRTCPSCNEGTLTFKVSRFGSGYFLGCNQHPNCKYIAKTLYGENEEDTDDEREKTAVQPPKLLGLNPQSNEKVLLKNGPYGPYLQLGEDKKGYNPKRASLSHIKDVESLTLEDALDLLKYPVTLGNHPDDGRPVILRLAKVGFSIKHRRNIAPVPKNVKPDQVTLEKALKFLQGSDVKRTGRPKRSALEKQQAIEAM